MNTSDLIAFLARNEARCASNVMCDDDCMFPYISIKKHQYYSYKVSGVNYAYHPNAYRMEHVCSYVRNAIAPNVDPQIDISGNYKIELHDTIQPRDRSGGCFCFSKNAKDRGNYALIPDEYQMQNYHGLLSYYKDDLTWDLKKSRALFCGTTTGNTTPSINERLKACDWASKSASSYADFYITKVAQMSRAAIVSAYPRTHGLFLKTVPIPIPTHYEYRYLVNIAGNTCCWNRLPMIMNSNSLMLNVYNSDMCWYYPALQEGVNFVPVKLYGDMLRKTMQYYDANPLEADLVVRNAHKFVNQFLDKSNSIWYATNLFENIAYYYKK